MKILFVVLAFTALALGQEQTTSRPKVFVTSDEASSANEVIKLFYDRCPLAVINTRQENADYIVQASNDHSGVARRGRRVVVSSSKTPTPFVALPQRSWGRGAAL